MLRKNVCSYLLIVWCLLKFSCLGVPGAMPEDDRVLSGVEGFYFSNTIERDTIEHCDLPSDCSGSYFRRKPLFVSSKYSGGMVLGKIKKLNIDYAQYFEWKIGVSSLGNHWKDIVYGMPYYGIGLGFYDLNSSQTGRPVSLYLFQGGTFKTFSKRSFLKYEWNFGTSFNWKEYHPVTNPDNEFIGTPVNIYFAVNMYHMYAFSKEIDLNVGFTFNHVSNGATHMPNSGINMLTGFVDLVYYFDRERIINEINPSLRAPVYTEKRLISDLSLHSTVRQRKFSTEETGLSSKYLDKSFFVMEGSYALLYMPDYNYRYGAGFDLVYDESAGFTAKKIGENSDGNCITEFRHGCFMGRFGLGLSFRGDIVMPGYSISGQLGYEVIKGNKMDNRVYQKFSMRVPLWNELYGSFVLRAQHFSKAQYMFFGIGYMINHRTFRKK